ncbi:MAG: Fic family protein [Methanomassiliicoccaceae archaeon]|nr:Fic family protein [Methanomassiliicoccaceae archaeon]
MTPDIEHLAMHIVDTIEKMEKDNTIEPLFRQRKANRIRSIHSSVAIEANSLSIEEVTDIINGIKIAGNPKEILEVKNAWKAYEGIGEYRPYSMDDLLLAHRRMSNELVREAGRFRSVEVGVYKGFELIHEGAKPAEIQELMEKVFEWGIKSNLHPLIKSCVIHFLIEFVHPFEDGNGRMGRLWQTVILADWNPVFQWIPIETLVYRNQYGYYDALHSAEQEDDAAFFVMFMLNIIKFTLDAIIGSRQAKNEPVNEPVNKIARRILEELSLKGDLTYDELAVILSVSRSTIMRNIRILKEAGLILRTGPDKTGRWKVHEK